MSRPKFAHLINTVSPADNANLNVIQVLTLRTILAAKDQASEDLEIELLSAQFENAHSTLPKGFRPTSNLKICAAGIKELNTRLKLPSLREILSKLDEAKDATHFIYSNLDICLMPFFYKSVEKYIDQGYDALVINRRRISSAYLEEKDLNVLYAEAGKTHTGYDCFVFSRQLLSKFILRDIFIGTPPSGNDLFYNIFTFAKKPLLLTQKHLTFHVGMELYKQWGDKGINAYNQQQFRLLLRDLRPFIDISKFPGANERFIVRHVKWLMNFTFHYPTMAIADFKQLGRRRERYRSSETSGIKHRYLEWLIKLVNFRDHPPL